MYNLKQQPWEWEFNHLYRPSDSNKTRQVIYFYNKSHKSDRLSGPIM